MRYFHVLWVLLFLSSTVALASPADPLNILTFDDLHGNGTFDRPYGGFSWYIPERGGPPKASTGGYTNNPAGVVSCCETAVSLTYDFPAHGGLPPYALQVLGLTNLNEIDFVSAYFTALGPQPEQITVFLEVAGTGQAYMETYTIGTTPMLVTFPTLPFYSNGSMGISSQKNGEPFAMDNLSYYGTPAPIPEPASLGLLLGGGLLAIKQLL